MPAISIHIQYTDDGCSEYVCTYCHNRTESRTPPQNFCTYCGTKFTEHKNAVPSPKRARREAPHLKVLRANRPKRPRRVHWIFMVYKDDPTMIISGEEIYTRSLRDLAECLRLHRSHKAHKFLKYWDCADEDDWERAARACFGEDCSREPHWFIKYHN